MEGTHSALPACQQVGTNEPPNADQKGAYLREWGFPPPQTRSAACGRGEPDAFIGNNGDSFRRPPKDASDFATKKEKKKKEEKLRDEAQNKANADPWRRHAAAGAVQVASHVRVHGGVCLQAEPTHPPRRDMCRVSHRSKRPLRFLVGRGGTT